MKPRARAGVTVAVAGATIGAGLGGIDLIFNAMTLPIWAELIARILTNLGWGAGTGALFMHLWLRSELKAIREGRTPYTTEELAERLGVEWPEGKRDDGV